MKSVNEQEFNEITKEGIVLVDFYADWCPPCKALSPVLEDLSKTHAGKINFIKVNTDVEGGLAQKFGVMSIPTVKIFKNGTVVKDFVGFKDKASIEIILDEAINS